MRIEHRAGDVMVRRIEVRRHPQNILTVEIATPLVAHPVVCFGSQSGGSGSHYFVDLYRPMELMFGVAKATRVMIFPESASEIEALAAGLFELDRWARWSALLVAIPAQVIGRANQLALWEASEPVDEVDYLRRIESDE